MLLPYLSEGSPQPPDVVGIGLASMRLHFGYHAGGDGVIAATITAVIPVSHVCKDVPALRALW